MSVIINGTAGVTFPDSVLQTSGVPAPGTVGNALISNGTIWTSAAISTKPFVTGTSMLFRQTAAPTGWTKVTTYNDYALRIVSGAASTGGSVAFTTAFASQTPAGSVSVNTSGLSAGATTLTTAQIPSHAHSQQPTTSGGDLGTFVAFANSGGGYSSANNTGSAGSGGSHTHTVSGSATGSFTGTAINLAVQYVDVIIANID
jgi:hypothetical protein